MERLNELAELALKLGEHPEVQKREQLYDPVGQLLFRVLNVLPSEDSAEFAARALLSPIPEADFEAEHWAHRWPVLGRRIAYNREWMSSMEEAEPVALTLIGKLRGTAESQRQVRKRIVWRLVALDWSIGLGEETRSALADALWDGSDERRREIIEDFGAVALGLPGAEAQEISSLLRSAVSDGRQQSDGDLIRFSEATARVSSDPNEQRYARILWSEGEAHALLGHIETWTAKVVKDTERGSAWADRLEQTRDYPVAPDLLGGAVLRNIDPKDEATWNRAQAVVSDLQALRIPVGRASLFFARRSGSGEREAAGLYREEFSAGDEPRFIHAAWGIAEWSVSSEELGSTPPEDLYDELIYRAGLVDHDLVANALAFALRRHREQGRESPLNERQWERLESALRNAYDRVILPAPTDALFFPVGHIDERLDEKVRALSMLALELLYRNPDSRVAEQWRKRAAASVFPEVRETFAGVG
ncbi:MAG: hypothetical protein AAFN13_11365 [Bacteroidota bacterium]